MHTKQCFRCGLDLPLSSFYKHKMMADGHLNKCKACTKRDVAEHRLLNLDKIREYDRERAKLPRRKQMAVERNKLLNKRPHFTAAHNAVSRAIRAGKIIRPEKCDRCDTTYNIQAHHDDHSRYFDIMWLCQSCHSKRHVELRRMRESTEENNLTCVNRSACDGA